MESDELDERHRKTEEIQATYSRLAARREEREGKGMDGFGQRDSRSKKGMRWQTRLDCQWQLAARLWL